MPMSSISWVISASNVENMDIMPVTVIWKQPVALYFLVEEVVEVEEFAPENLAQVSYCVGTMITL